MWATRHVSFGSTHQLHRGRGGKGGEGVLTAEEEGSRLVVGRDALQQGQGVAHPVRGRGRELRRVEEVVDADDLLEKRRHDT